MPNRSNFLSIPITSILASLYPVLFLAAANWDQVKYRDIGRSITVSILLGLIFLLFCRLFVQSWKKAALLGSVLALLFFSYGHTYQYIEASNIKWLEHHKLFFAIYLTIFIISLWLIRKAIKVDSLTLYLNIVLAGFCLFSIVKIWPVISGYVSESFYKPVRSIAQSNQQELPDVYLLVLDGYPRDDISKEVLNLDNSGFTNDLRNMGFYVADCSQSNYNYTKLSLDSMLNMEYIKEAPDKTDPLQFQRTNNAIVDRLKHSKFRSTLENLGYKTAAFETGYAFTEIADSDYYYPLVTDKIILNKFESMLVNTTIFYPRYDFNTWITGKTYKENVKKKELDKNLVIYSYELNRFVMRKVSASVTDLPGPKFILAHMMVTHYPYVMKPDGTINEQDVYETKSLAKQLPYINDYLINLVKSIKSESENTPIIIIMGDHGYRLNEQIILKNYLSVHAPQSILDRMYPTITPINLFRIIMTEVYGQDYPLVEDRSFITTTVGDPNLREFPGGCPVK